MNNYKSILSDYQLIQKLTKPELQLYSFFIENKKLSPFTYSNEYLAKVMNKRVETVSRYVSRLKDFGLLDVKYIPDRNGTKRVIKLAKVKNEN